MVIILDFKKNININIPKFRTTFAQSLPYNYVFINFCIKFKINLQDFYGSLSFKKRVADIIMNKM